MSKNFDNKWYVALIKQNSYDTAIKNLERQGFETFLPKMEITQRQKNQFVVKNAYVFPGYMFVSFDPRSITWTKINSTYGVSKILSFNNKPAEISSDFVLKLKKRYEIDSNSRKKGELFKGDYIKFYKGIFSNLIGKIESVDKKNRIWILLESMGGYKKLKLQNVEKNRYYKL